MMVGVAPDLRAVEGKPAAAALEVIYRRQYQSLVGLARLLLDDRGQAEEVVQEAFTRTYVASMRGNGIDDLLAYVRQAVVNLARSGLRRRRTVRITRVQALPNEVAAEVHAVASDARRRVGAAVQALPRRQRECVVLRYFSECSTAETARTLDLSEGAVKAYLHRALSTLGTALEDVR